MTKSLAMLVVAATLLAGCDHMNTQQQRALSGGAIGAAGGAAIAGLTGGSVLWGGLLGGGAGAAVGAVSAQH